MDNPSNPAAEFRNINAAVTAAVSFMLDQPRSKSRGLRMIPPPIPIIPEKKPSTAPIGAAIIKGGGFADSDFSGNLINNLKTAINKQMPRIILYVVGSISVLAPTNAMGIEAVTNGSNIFHLKYPAL